MSPHLPFSFRQLSNIHNTRISGIHNTRIIMPLAKSATAALVLVGGVHAHFSFVHKPSQIACNWDDDKGRNGIGGPINWLAHPLLAGAPFADWWLHGQANCQDEATGVFELPAGGTTAVAMSSRVNSAPPPYGNGEGFKPSDPDFVFSAEEWIEPLQGRMINKGNHIGGRHNIHSYTRDDTSGCALAIAYKSKAVDVEPEDFVIFTVVHDCPKRQREFVDVPDLPACPDGNCICAWLWNPKNSGAKNFYMTPFVCNVVGADPNASPVDVQYAIPPRRCLDPKNCNFGPRQPMYYLGEASSEINMAEPNHQSPHYSILYGFREGAQHDIFENTNPRRHVDKSSVNMEEPPRCDNNEQVGSRLLESDAEKTSWLLKSSNCGCTAELKDGLLTIDLSNNETTQHSDIPSLSPTNPPTQFPTTANDRQVKSLAIVGNNGYPAQAFPLSECQGDCDSDLECQDSLVCLQRDAGDPVPGCLGSDDASRTDYCIQPPMSNLTTRRDENRVWHHNVTSTFGPMDVVGNSSTYKAGHEYFPFSHGPYRMDLSDECYLYVTSGDGVVVWESPVDDEVADLYVIDTFTGRDPDPVVWPAVVDYSLTETTPQVLWRLEDVRGLRGRLQ